MIKVNGIRLLSRSEFTKYKDKIPPLKIPWWLSDSRDYQRDMIGFVSLSNEIQFTYPHLNRIYLRPALDIESELSESDKRIKLFGKWWVILNKNLVIAEEAFFETVYNDAKDYSSSYMPNYEESKIKTLADEWLHYAQVPTF